MLTPAGNVLLERWSNLRPEFENSLKQAHNISVINQKALKIGILYGFDFETLLAYLIPEFENSEPSVKADINIYDFNEMKNKINELDFVFSTNFEIESRNEYSIVSIKSRCILLFLRSIRLQIGNTLLPLKSAMKHLWLFLPLFRPTLCRILIGYLACIILRQN